MLRVITEDGYRDLTKYGFRSVGDVWRRDFDPSANADIDIFCEVDSESFLIIYAEPTFIGQIETERTHDLAFLLKMFQDGILEVVNE